MNFSNIENKHAELDAKLGAIINLAEACKRQASSVNLHLTDDKDKLQSLCCKLRLSVAAFKESAHALLKDMKDNFDDSAFEEDELGVFEFDAFDGAFNEDDVLNIKQDVDTWLVHVERISEAHQYRKLLDLNKPLTQATKPWGSYDESAPHFHRSGTSPLFFSLPSSQSQPSSGHEKLLGLLLT